MPFILNRHLLYPLETVLDDSIGCALWFAGRGAVHCSPVRVLLLGMGADEQLGGYTRHRVRFKEGGWKALTEEMSMEVSSHTVFAPIEGSIQSDT